MSKATDIWFRILKGMPLNEQMSCKPGYVYDPTERDCVPATTAAEGNFCADPKNDGQLVPGLEGFICKGNTAVRDIVDPAGPTAPTQTAAGVAVYEKCVAGGNSSRQCLDLMSARTKATRKIQQIAKQEARRRKTAVKFAQSVVGDIIFGDAHLPKEERKLAIDGAIGPETLKAFANVGIDSSFIGDDPADRKNWRLATRNIEVIRNALAEKYDAALPYIGVDSEKVLAAAQAVEMTAKRIAQTPRDDIPSKGEGGGIISGVKFRDVGFKRIYPRRKGGLKHIVIHESVTPTAQRAIDVLLRKNLSIHFGVDKNGETEQHVSVNKKAIHAGALNKFGIGVEVTNPSGYGAPSKAYKPGNAAQMEAVYDLVKKISQATGIPMSFPNVQGENFNFGKIILADGIIPHGSYRGSDHSDARFPVLYMVYRHAGKGASDAYEAAIQTLARARGGGKGVKRSYPDGKARKCAGGYWPKAKHRFWKKVSATYREANIAKAGTKKPKVRCRSVMVGLELATSRVAESKKLDLKEGIKVKIGEKKTLTEAEWWRNRRKKDNKAYNINLGKKYRRIKHVKKGGSYVCDPPPKLAGGIKPTKSSKC